MRMTWRQLLNLTVSTALVIASVPVHAVQVEIKQDIRFRQMRSGHQVLGILKAGSIIDVSVSETDRQNQTDANGYRVFDLHKTLQYMLQHPHDGNIAYKNIDGRRVPLFKVTVVGKAAGSSYNATLGSSSMIALDFLERRGKTYVNTGTQPRVQTTEDAPVYSAGGFDDSADGQDQQGSTAECATCNNQSTPVPQDRLDELAQLGSIAAAPSDSDDAADGAIDQPASGQLQGLHIAGKPECNRFIGQDGSYGDYGRDLANILHTMPDYQTKTAAFADVCPNFKNFSAEERTHFEVWTIAAAASIESGCMAGARAAHARNGVALGLMQVEGNPALREYNHRGAACYPGRNVDMRIAHTNLACAASMIDDTLVSNNKSIETPVGDGQYYEALGARSFKVRKHGRTSYVPNPVMGIIASYHDCRN